MPEQTSINSISLWTIWTFVGSFSCVSYNMILHMILPQCCFWTKWTAKFLMSKLNWHILQFNKRQSSILITCLLFISHAFRDTFLSEIWNAHCSIRLKKDRKITHFYAKKCCEIPWCLSICLRRLIFCEQEWSHIVQENGFSPVWVKICFFITSFLLVIFGQHGQPYSITPSLIGWFCKIIKDNATVLFCRYIHLFISKKFYC